MSDIIITVNKKIDRALINDDTQIVFVNNYMPDSVLNVDFKYSDLSTDEKESLNKLLDFASFSIESDAIVFIVKRNEKEFDLSSSYVRDVKSTASPLTELTIGQSLLVRFEVPGFLQNTVREISLFYDEDFLTTDLDLLDEIGITLTGNGKVFEIENAVECKVSFLKPEIITDNYVISDELSNQILS